MKKGLLLVILICCTVVSFAGHVAGGEIFYKLIGPGTSPNTNQYEITLRLFRECNPPAGGQPTAPLPTSVVLGIFNNGFPATPFANNIPLARTSATTLNLGTVNPCITNAPEVCYEIAYFVTTRDLPITSAGYIVAFQTCCRTNGIANLAGNSQGATYTAQIPGTALFSGNNSSPVFALKDTTLVCRNSPMTLDFSATDPDGDSLVYSFCSAYNGGDKTDSSPLPPSNPQYGTLNYSIPYNGNEPLGASVDINSRTGIISGVSPNIPGRYVVNVCISEYRGDTLISTHRKDFTLQIGDCSLSGAELEPSYITCDGFTWTFQNESSASNVTSYAWNFGDPGSGTANNAATPVATHTFSDTGRFVVKLTVANSAGCQDSAFTVMAVYPGFETKFSVNGNCYQSPFSFSDGTTTSYGVVDSWRWDFGETVIISDTSRLKNPSYLYPNAGPRNVRLISTNSKGCIDTAFMDIDVRENPVLDLPFKDTLICSVDDLPLQAQGTGSFSWIAVPNDPSLTTPNSQNPIVSPNDTTLYIVTLNDNGCTKKDTIKVNVLEFITVELGVDTGICRTDTLIMRTESHALRYLWTPATGLDDPSKKFPVASPTVTTRYHVTANLGAICEDTASILVQVAPYPTADAGPGGTVCFGETIPLSGSFLGSGFAWSPTNTLSNPNTLTPTAGPDKTTPYVLTVFSQGICPKPSFDTALVIVRPVVKAFAGNDTFITALQPLQLNATGASFYTWSPATGLSSTNISNPIATLGANIDSIIYRVRVRDSAGCSAEDDVKVIVFKTGPDIFIPTGFTPNKDGKNDVMKPTLVGMQTLNYFSIFNRWGQMLFTTSQAGKGWDGNFGGKEQPAGTYVFAAQAIDYTGKVVLKKGTVVLIR